MREVKVESVQGWVESAAGYQMSADGTRFSAVGELGQSIVYEMRGRGRATDMIGKTVVRAQIFLQNRLNRDIFGDQQLPVDPEV
ncbi:MAG: hypothetical protein ABIR37_03875 [Candidatus Saccharimonadales bacterium]